MFYFSFPGNFFMTLDRRFKVRVIENFLKYPVTSFQNLNQAQKSIKWKKNTGMDISKMKYPEKKITSNLKLLKN